MKTMIAIHHCNLFSIFEIFLTDITSLLLFSLMGLSFHIFYLIFSGSSIFMFILFITVEYNMIKHSLSSEWLLIDLVLFWMILFINYLFQYTSTILTELFFIQLFSFQSTMRFLLT